MLRWQASVWWSAGRRPPAGPRTPPTATPPTAPSITYVGVTSDQPDLAGAGLGEDGFWFAQFDAAQPVEGRPTGENARDSLPPWVAPFSHFPEDRDFAARTFSQDGPARSEGGQPGWETLTLPDGEVGRSGAIVDPATAGNTNNTINRIQLRGEVPSTFYFHVVTDNTDLDHDPTNLLRARGNLGPTDADDTQVEADTFPEAPDLSFNGAADVYTFRYDGFTAGDYLKLRLNGDSPPAGGASFGGLLFDRSFAGDPAPPCTAPVDPAPAETPPDVPPVQRAPTTVPPAGPARPVAAQPTFTG